MLVARRSALDGCGLRGSISRVSSISPQGQRPEESAQDIFAFGYPSHRFHVQRMQRKESGDKCAAPEGSGQALERKEDDHRVCEVEKQARQVVACRIQSVQLHVKHVGDPGQWMPVPGMASCQRPPKAFHRKTVLDVWIQGDVIRVIVVDEPAMEHGPESQESDQREEKTDKNGIALIFLVSHWFPKLPV